MAQRVGQAGRASTSARLGAQDPRLRRNAQLNTNDRDIAAPIVVGQNGKLGLALSAFFRVENRQLTFDADQFAKAVGEILAAPLELKNGEVRIKPAGTVALLDVGATLLQTINKLNEVIGDFHHRGDLEG